MSPACCARCRSRSILKSSATRALRGLLIVLENRLENQVEQILFDLGELSLELRRFGRLGAQQHFHHAESQSRIQGKHAAGLHRLNAKPQKAACRLESIREFPVRNLFEIADRDSRSRPERNRQSGRQLSGKAAVQIPDLLHLVRRQSVRPPEVKGRGLRRSGGGLESVGLRHLLGRHCGIAHRRDHPM